MEIVGKYENEKFRVCLSSDTAWFPVRSLVAFKILCLETPSQPFSCFPSSNKQLHTSMSELTLKRLNASLPTLSSSFPPTHGNDGVLFQRGSNGFRWCFEVQRTSVDEALEFTQDSLS